MQRRNFLRGILGIAATAAAAPLIKLLPAPAAPVLPRRAGFKFPSATIDQYADYVSFSDLALETSLDPDIERAAKEISYRFHYTYNNFILNQLNASPSFHAALAETGYQIDQRELARFNRVERRARYVAKQRRRSARMAA